MNNQLFEKLIREADWAEWSILHNHFVHDNLFLIEPNEDLFEFAIAVSENDATLVAAKIDAGLVRRPDGYDVESWRKSGQRFLTVITSPYVLVQCMDEAQYEKFMLRRQEVIKEA